jgi:hypothetical protein
MVENIYHMLILQCCITCLGALPSLKHQERYPISHRRLPTLQPDWGRVCTLPIVPTRPEKGKREVDFRDGSPLV